MHIKSPNNFKNNLPSLFSLSPMINPINIISPSPPPISPSQKPTIIASSSLNSFNAKSNLLRLISDQKRGLKTQKNPSKREEIIVTINDLAVHGAGTVTTDSSLSGAWRMLWTTEKEQLFIIKNSRFFGTETGDVLQVIDVEKGLLNNVITFPPSGVFFVRSEIRVGSPQRVDFRFTSAVLRGAKWEIPLPPFGQGWFESVYMDEEIRVAKDIRGDYLVVDRAPYSWKE